MVVTSDAWCCVQVALFSLFLLLAVVKGINKFGTRFALIAVYPMKPHGTLMNSFLFNTAYVARVVCMPRAYTS